MPVLLDGDVALRALETLGAVGWPIGVGSDEDDVVAVGQGWRSTAVPTAWAGPGEKPSRPSRPTQPTSPAGTAYRALNSLRIPVRTYLRRKRQL
jgi:hypothetical protein